MFSLKDKVKWNLPTMITMIILGKGRLGPLLAYHFLMTCPEESA